VLLLLVVLAGALLAMAIVQRDRALQKEYDDAQRRAELYAATVFRNTLGPGDVATPLEGSRRESLFAEVQAYVLTDPTIARVRLWSPDGTQLFSTDRADNPGDTSQDPLIASAAGGSVQSRLAEEALSPPPTVEGRRRLAPLFQTFAPLRVRGSANVVGAVEVEQTAAELENRADDPWWLVQAGASGAAVLLALIALISVARGMRRPAPPKRDRAKDQPSRRKRRDAGWGEGDSDLRERLEQATARAKEAEAAAQSFAASLQQVSNRLESVESQSSDERVAELKESLRRSEAERAMLRAGRPETLVEAEVRELRGQLRESQALAKAAEALVAGGGDLSAVQEQLSTAARQVEVAVERAKIAEGRADAAEDRARATGDMATAAEQRIDLLEMKLQEIAAGVGTPEGPEADELQRQLAEARQQADEMARRAAEVESRLAVAGSLDGPAEELLQSLEERVVAAETRALEAEARIRPFEEEAAEGGSRFRQRLGLTAAGRKLAAPAPALAERETLPEMDLRTAIARGLRGPLTRATGLTLAIQGTIESGEGKAALRQLSSSLRRLDQLAADLHQVHRMIDGSLPLNRRRTDLAALIADILDDPVTLEERLIRLDADTVHVRVDPARARQIVEGMLDAARERTRSGAAIVVRVRDTDAGGRVSVEDDNRIPATIGPEMSLAVRLAELHGAEITVDGSSYRVVFPKDEGL
jgi:hypothetical protein